MGTWHTVYHRVQDVIFVPSWLVLPWFFDRNLSKTGRSIFLVSWFAFVYFYVWWVVVRRKIIFPTPARWLAVRPPNALGAIHFPTPLCEGCHKILSQSRLLNGTWRFVTPSVEWHNFHGVGLDYQRTSDIPCHLCTILFATVQAAQPNPFFPETHLFSLQSTPSYGSIRPVEFQHSSRAQVALKIFQLPIEDGVTRVQLYMPMDEVSEAFIIHKEYWSSRTGHEDSTSKPRSSSTWSSESVQAAKQFLDICDRDHVECDNENDFLPTRLLEIASDRKTVRVIPAEGPMPPTSMKYSALSHCWGPSGIRQRLTTKNFLDWCRSVAVDTLPRNFQDAITITSDLGYQYIWIDSMCILQDSTEDWRAESSTMGDVFANAVVTISATASRDAEGGCFRERDSFLYTDCTLMASNTSRWFMYVSPRVREQDMTLDDLFNYRVDHAPLSRRAWTFQERFLSRRIIHFCDGVILFECNTIRGSEGFGSPQFVPYERKEYIRKDGMIYTGKDLETLKLNAPEFLTIEEVKTRRAKGSTRVVKYRTKRLEPNPNYWKSERERQKLIAGSARAGIRGALDMLQSLPTSTKNMFWTETLEYHLRWYELVNAYSGRHLTYRSDRLIALSGLVNLVTERTNWRYAAGLWETTLAFDLLWYVPEPAKTKSSEHLAPSWSWASAEGRVESALAGSSNIIAHRTKFAGFQTKGVRAEVHINNARTSVDDSHSHPPYLLNSGSITLEGQMKFLDIAAMRTLPIQADYEIDYDYPEYIALAVYSEAERDIAGGGTGWGLLLQPVGDAADDVYERCGLISGSRDVHWNFEKGWNTTWLTII